MKKPVRYFVIKCPKCGWTQGYYNRGGDITKARKTCNRCSKNFKIHTHITKYSTIQADDYNSKRLRLKMKEIKTTEQLFK